MGPKVVVKTRNRRDDILASYSVETLLLYYIHIVACPKCREIYMVSGIPNNAKKKKERRSNQMRKYALFPLYKGLLHQEWIITQDRRHCLLQIKQLGLAGPHLQKIEESSKVEEGQRQDRPDITILSFCLLIGRIFFYGLLGSKLRVHVVHTAAI